MKRDTLIKTLCLVILVLLYFYIFPVLSVSAEDYENLTFKTAYNYDDCEDLLDDEIFLILKGNKTGMQNYEKTWSIDVEEPGYLILNKFYNEGVPQIYSWSRSTFYDSYIEDSLYSNKILSNSISGEKLDCEISSVNYKYKQVSKYYLTPGTYYLRMNGEILENENFACSVAFLSSKELIGIDSIEYSNDYKSAVVKFKLLDGRIKQLQVLNKRFKPGELFFGLRTESMECYDLSAVTADRQENQNRVDSIVKDGLQLNQNGEYSLLVEYYDDPYASFPIALSFKVDKIGYEEPVEVKTVKLSKTKIKLKVGNTYSLTATIKPKNVTDKNVTWKSSNKKVATVDKNGKITAKKKGTCTITVTTSNGKKAKCKVTVKK